MDRRSIVVAILVLAGMGCTGVPDNAGSGTSGELNALLGPSVGPCPVQEIRAASDARVFYDLVTEDPDGNPLPLMEPDFYHLVSTVVVTSLSASAAEELCNASGFYGDETHIAQVEPVSRGTIPGNLLTSGGATYVALHHLDWPVEWNLHVLLLPIAGSPVEELDFTARMWAE